MHEVTTGKSAAAGSRTYDVAIVGCGPTGAVLANLLGAMGVSVVVFERESTPSPLPRALHFDGEVMRIFQSIGVADRIASVARAGSQGTRFINADGKTLLIRRSFDKPGPQGWAVNWYFHQPELERELRSALDRFPNVELKLRHEVRELVKGADQVSIEAEDMAAPGVVNRFTASYVVGCDGARSLVRRSMNATLEDLGLHQPWLVVDVVVDSDSPRVRALPEHAIQLCDPRRPMSVIYVTGKRRRWEIMVMPGDDVATMTEPDRFWPMLSRWIAPEDGSIERSAVYTFHSLIARGWRDDRLLLAGDSCHQTPPFLGQGMCAGIRDAANLAWKLAWVIKGEARPTLLDTYETERRPHVETFIKLAVELGGIIQTTDPSVAAERDRQFAVGEPAIFQIPQPQLGAGVRHAGPPPQGNIFPQPRLTSGQLLDDVVGGRFCVICDQALLDEADAAAHALWQRIGAVVLPSDAEPETRVVLAELGVRAVILRPDTYIYGAARDARELARLSRELRGHFV